MRGVPSGALPSVTYCLVHEVRRAGIGMSIAGAVGRLPGQRAGSWEVIEGALFANAYGATRGRWAAADGGSTCITWEWGTYEGSALEPPTEGALVRRGRPDASCCWGS